MRNITHTYRAILLGGVGACSLIGAPAMASDTQDTQANTVQEVVVTANKRSEKLHDVAQSVTAVSGEDLDRRVLTNWSDYQAQVPGLSIQATSPALSRVTIRGLNSGGSGSIVSIVVDDSPFTYSTGLGDGAITTQNFDPYDTKQVEVLRGPQGTLYGAGAEGGLIKFVTNAPSFAGYQAGAEAGGSSVNHGGSGWDAKGYVNIPIASNFAIRLTAVYEDLPGYISNWYTGEKNVNKGSKYAYRASALWQPNEDLSLRLTLFGQGLKIGAPSEVDAVGAALTPGAPPPNATAFARGLSFGAAAPQASSGYINGAYLNAVYDLHFAKLTSITSYGVLQNHFQSDITGAEVAPGVSYSTIFSGVYGQPVALQIDNPFKLHKYSEELRLSSEPNSSVAGLPLDWQVGGLITREAMAWQQSVYVYKLQPNPSPTPITTPPGGDALLPAPYDEVSAFGDIVAHFTPKFDVELGARWTDIRQQSQINLQCCVFFGPSQTLPLLKSDQTATTYSIAPRYRFGDDTVVYARVASGFRPGGPELIIPGAPPDFPTSYGSDSTVNYEAGLRTYLMDRKVSIDVAAYHIDWSHIQIISLFTSASTGGVFGVVGNAGQARSDGFEWNLSWRAAPGLTLSDVGSYVDARLTKDATDLGGKSGDRLPNVPDVTNSLNFDYVHPAFGDWNAFIGGTWSYTGKTYTAFVSPTALGTNSARRQLPSYNTVALQGGVQNGRYTFELYVHNLTDSRALTNYSSSGAYGAYGVDSIIQPRTIGFRIAAKY